MSRYYTIEILPEDEDGGSFGQNPDDSPVQRAMEREEGERRRQYYAQFRRSPEEERERQRRYEMEDMEQGLEDNWQR